MADVRGVTRRFGRMVVLAERRGSRHRALEDVLETLLDGRALRVEYQPILRREVGVDGVGRWRVEAAEALVRAGTGPGALRPAQFLPAMTRAGLLDSLLQFVLAEALAALLDWQRGHGLALGLSVNVHGEALLDDALPGLLAGVLDVTGVAPARLTLEINGTPPTAELGHAAANLARLRALGLRTALDDPGAGPGIAARLAWFDCDEFKLERALVQDLESSEERRGLVESLISLAHGRGMAVCAEGVESHAALHLLGAFGCDRAQGFLFARPAPAAQFVGHVRSWQAQSLFTGEAEDADATSPGPAASWTGGDADVCA